jgi:cell division septation protein DedD
MSSDQNYSQGQFEFFTPQTRSNQTNGKRYTVFRSLNITVDNMVIGSIVLVMVFLLVFSIGVERGKQLAWGEKNPVQIDQNSVSLQSSLSPSMINDSTETVTQTISLPPDDGPENPVASPATDTVPKTPDEGFTVQIATYKGEKRAREVVEQLQKLGHESFFLSKGEYVIVCVGKFSGKNEAKKYSLELKKKYKDCYVRRI